MLHPNPKMLLRIAQGDAFGMACEFRTDNLKAALEFDRYIRHPEWGPEAGHYTDDTQMSIAVAESLIHPQGRRPPKYARPEDLTKEALAEAFVQAYKRDPRPGYAVKFQAFLDSVSSGTEFLLKINPESDKNGAAMRSVPLGVILHEPKLLEVAATQASLTHNTEGGITSSQMVALASRFAMYESAPLTEIFDYIGDWLHLSNLRWEGGPVVGPNLGMLTARAAITLVIGEPNLLSIAKKALIWGGDTDSVLAIAWGIASARKDGAELPDFLHRDLENGPYGRDYLTGLGENLMWYFAPPSFEFAAEFYVGTNAALHLKKD